MSIIIINLLDITSNQPSKPKTKNWVKINYESHGMYNIDNQIKFNLIIVTRTYFFKEL